MSIVAKYSMTIKVSNKFLWIKPKYETRHYIDIFDTEADAKKFFRELEKGGYDPFSITLEEQDDSVYTCYDW